MTVMEPGHIQPGSVVITPTQMYDEMRAISKAVDHLAAIVDPALAEVRADVAENKTNLHAARAELWSEVRSLRDQLHAIRNRLWFAAGGAVALGGAGGWIGSHLTGG